MNLRQFLKWGLDFRIKIGGTFFIKGIFYSGFDAILLYLGDSQDVSG